MDITGKAEKRLLYPFWKSIGIKTLVLFGEDDEYINANKK